MSNHAPFMINNPPSLKEYGLRISDINQSEEGDFKKHQAETAAWGFLYHEVSEDGLERGLAGQSLDSIVDKGIVDEDPKWKGIIKKYKMTQKQEIEHRELTWMFDVEHSRFLYTLPVTITTSKFWRRSSQVSVVEQETKKTEEYIFGSEKSQLEKLDQTLKHMITNTNSTKVGGGGGISIGPVNFGAKIESDETSTEAQEKGASQSSSMGLKHTAQFKLSNTVTLQPGFAYCSWELVEHVNVKFDIPSHIAGVEIAGILIRMGGIGAYRSFSGYQVEPYGVELEEDYFLSLQNVYQDSCKKDELGHQTF